MYTDTLTTLKQLRESRDRAMDRVLDLDERIAGEVTRQKRRGWDEVSMAKILEIAPQDVEAMVARMEEKTGGAYISGIPAKNRNVKGKATPRYIPADPAATPEPEPEKEKGKKKGGGKKAAAPAPAPEPTPEPEEPKKEAAAAPRKRNRNRKRTQPAAPAVTDETHFEDPVYNPDGESAGEVLPA